jgi:MFS family permease
MLKSASEDYGYENDDILTDVISSFCVFSDFLGEIAGPIFAGVFADLIGFKSTCAIAGGINLLSGIIFAIGTGASSFFQERKKYNSL